MDDLQRKNTLEFKCNTASLLKEILDANNNMQIFRIPFKIFAGLLYDVAKRASELNDPKLNALMCKLSLYAIADQYSEDFNQEMVNKILALEP